MDDHTGGRKPAEEAAVYIAAMTEDLAALARRHGLGPLGYLLDMARLEAEGAANSWNSSDQ
jgi:hypothetical protein